MSLTLPLPSPSQTPQQRLPHEYAEISGPAPQLSKVLLSRDILRGQKTVEISHNGLIYRLQATRLGKLILTK